MDLFDSARLRRTFELAPGHHTHPNPGVGALVVKDGVVVGEGFHSGPGSEHAEVVALAAAGDAARGADLYVSLEPCSHHGRTPPCVDAVLAAGVGRIVIGIEDPDPRVSGSGVAKLRDAGVDVVLSDEPEAAEAVDPAYFHHRRTGLPRVTAKFAMTLDGSVAAMDGTSQWITSPEARHDAHILRSQVDAVVIGAGTLRSDNPRLDVRIDGYAGPQPRAVIVAGSGPLPAEAQIWELDPLVITAEGGSAPGGEVVGVSGSDPPAPALVASTLGDMGYLEILLEGGPTLLASWWEAGVITRGYAYVAAKVGGGAGITPFAGSFGNIADARAVEIFDVQSVGPDVRIGFQ
ncbi:MAG: bifunctional diaminohydroxyphosphoribosylaminopyrimidine deaminase/5-amino-6-(5-phosphoribosylamino)uracil reductase RibD [Acidimicrobiia bacterium]